MSKTSDHSGWWVLLGGAIILALVLSPSQQKQTKVIIQTFEKSQMIIDSKKYPDLPIVTKEIIEMLNESIKKEHFVMKYPVAFGMLIRSCYEQSIKVFLRKNNVYFNKKATLGYLEKIAIKNADKDVAFNQKINELMKINLRDKGNYSVHVPSKNEDFGKLLDLLQSLAEFAVIVSELNCSD